MTKPDEKQIKDAVLQQIQASLGPRELSGVYRDLLREAKKSTHPKTQTAAMLRDANGRQACRAHNSESKALSELGIAMHDYACVTSFTPRHGEINAIRTADFPLENGVLYVTQCPCPNCMKNTAHAGCRGVVEFRDPGQSDWHNRRGDVHNLLCRPLYRHAEMFHVVYDVQRNRIDWAASTLPDALPGKAGHVSSQAHAQAHAQAHCPTIEGILAEQDAEQDDVTETMREAAAMQAEKAQHHFSGTGMPAAGACIRFVDSCGTVRIFSAGTGLPRGVTWDDYAGPLGKVERTLNRGNKYQREPYRVPCDPVETLVMHAKRFGFGQPESVILDIREGAVNIRTLLKFLKTRSDQNSGIPAPGLIEIRQAGLNPDIFKEREARFEWNRKADQTELEMRRFDWTSTLHLIACAYEKQGTIARFGAPEGEMFCGPYFVPEIRELPRAQAGRPHTMTV